ncbi:MAG: hypothetical protein ACFFD2_16195 [Promethearchaeota archaeon]
MRPLKIDPTKLDPEVKWRTSVSLFLNYIKAFHYTLKEKLDDKIAIEFHNYLVEYFWSEQSQAFIDLFALNPKSVIDAHSLKRTFAVILDIKYKPIIENEEEVIDEMEYVTCPFRNSLSPIFEGVCEACERIGQIFVKKLDANNSHKVVIENNICRHITKKKT